MTDPEQPRWEGLDGQQVEPGVLEHIRIRREGDRIHVSLPFKYAGEVLTPEVVRQIQAAIMEIQHGLI